jgi:hypothetical protein
VEQVPHSVQDDNGTVSERHRAKDTFPNIVILRELATEGPHLWLATLSFANDAPNGIADILSLRCFLQSREIPHFVQDDNGMVAANEKVHPTFHDWLAHHSTALHLTSPTDPTHSA